MNSMTKTKSNDLSMSLIAILVLIVLVFGITIYKNTISETENLTQRTKATNRDIFVGTNSTVTPMPDTLIDKKLKDLNEGAVEVDKSLIDTPVTNL